MHTNNLGKYVTQSFNRLFCLEKQINNTQKVEEIKMYHWWLSF